MTGRFDILAYYQDVNKLKNDVEFIKKKIQKMSEMNESFSKHSEEFLFEMEDEYNRTLKRVRDGVIFIGGCICILTLKKLFGEF